MLPTLSNIKVSIMCEQVGYHGFIMDGWWDPHEMKALTGVRFWMKSSSVTG